jgi:hypothetical protein
VDQSISNKPFLFSLYYGESKPSDVNMYLKFFVEEMRVLENEGLEFNGMRFDVRIRCIIADAPARSFRKCVRNHNAYYGCERCNRKGKWEKRVVYPTEKVGVLYTDLPFEDQSHFFHHEGISPLISLNLGMITQIPLDYMHLICLGIVKKLLLTWTSGPLSARLGPRQILNISRRLISIRS